MRTEEERLTLLHKRAEFLKRRREKNILTALGGVSFGLCVCLISLMAAWNGPTHYALSGQFAGASLLGGMIGGYVLVAVISFTVATIITVLCIRRREKRKRNREDERRRDSEGRKTNEKTQTDK